MIKLYQLLFKQVNASALSVFRIGLGGILFFDCINYGIFLCLQCDYHDTQFLFKYAGFEWVHPLSTAGLRAVWLAMGVCALGIMLGWYYRFCMIAYTIGFIYLFLLDQALYLNHFYMVILFCVLMCFIPANRHWAMDARRHAQPVDEPAGSASRSLMPNWPRFLLAAQLEIILIHAGLVKINYDWLNLEPLRLWLTSRSADEGPLLQFLTQDWGIAVASYGAILLHLVGAPLLLFRSTRLYALAAYAIFHLTNAFVFNIGIFPWFTLFASLLLFDPDWPLQVWNKLRWRFKSLSQRFPDSPFRAVGAPWSGSSSSSQHTVAVLVCVWLTVQILVPLRHWVLPGDVAWNEVGHRFSWRMKLRSKRALAKFHVKATDANGKVSWEIDPKTRLTRKQARVMPCIPDMAWQFAQHLDQYYSNQGYTDVEVYADIYCSLNGRRAARFIRRDVDLTTIDRATHPDKWIVPLQEPLRNPLFSI